jgi:hypothetical protein
MVYVLTVKSIPVNGFPVKPDENGFPRNRDVVDFDHFLPVNKVG